MQPCSLPAGVTVPGRPAPRLSEGNPCLSGLQYLPGPCQVLGRNLLRQPDAVDGAIERKTVRGHPAGGHLVDPGLSVPGPNLESRLVIPGQMDVEPGLGDAKFSVVTSTMFLHESVT